MAEKAQSSISIPAKAYCVEIADNYGQTLDLVDAEEKDIAAVIWRAKE